MQNPNMSTDQTNLDLAAALAAGGAGVSAGKGGVYITFQWHMITLKTTNLAKNGQRERRLKVVKTPVGDPSTVAVSFITPAMAERHFPAEWSYFNKHGDMPMNGTALSELPGVSVSQIQIMNINGVRSVEDLLGIPSESISRIGLEGQIIQRVAIEWDNRRKESSELIDYAEVSAKQASALSAETAKTHRLQEEMLAMRAQLEALQRVMPAAQGTAPTAMGGATGIDAAIERISAPEVGDAMPNPLAECEED